eukprot:7209221-Ditylum_brightwellii.AAC.1
MARTAAKTDPDGASTVTVKQVHDFQRGHRRDLTVLSILMVIVKYGLCAREIGTEMPPMMGLNNSWKVVILCHQMEQKQGNFTRDCVKGCQGLIYIRKHEITLDGRKAF